MTSVPPQFEEWIDHVFNHPVKERAWYWDEEFIELEPELFIAYGTKLFKAAGRILSAFEGGQIDQGLNLMLGNNASSQIFALKDATVPMERRVEFIEGIFDLVRDVFEARCTPHLSHLDWSSAPEHVSRLNMICIL